MLFSSVTFLYYFLPLLIILYFILKKHRNNLLLVFSLFFYFYGEPKFILVLLSSIIINYYFSKWIYNNPTKKRMLLILSLIINLGILFYFKYFNFIIECTNDILNLDINILNISLPLGISFFTFQAISYVVDVYLNKVKPAKNIFEFGTYLSLFPQLVAGPIVRYETIADELKRRKITTEMFASGIKRFIIGLSKKVILANTLGEIVTIFASLSQKTIISNWLVGISYSLQIYFDFSGYSDMAIGLGLMLGFRFLENFNYPFIASSITDFWRRWHISLSSFFRDYVYIPLGGNRVSKKRWIFNLFVVWFLTGLWHGASYNFILWGLYFFILLILEKMFLNKFIKNKIFSHIYTIILVIISFVIFRETDISELFITLKSMFGFNNLKWINIETIYYLKNFSVFLIISIILSTPIVKLIKQKINKPIIEYVGCFILLVIVTSYLVSSSSNPFLYFRF